MSEHEDLLELLRRSFDQSAAVIAAVSPEQLRLPTPCEQFDVRSLVGHLLFAARRLEAAGRRAPVPLDGPAVTGLADEEWLPAFEKIAAEALAAWQPPAARSGEVVLPFGTFPAPAVLQVYVMEQVAHAWDLAVAIGWPGGLDAELAEASLTFGRGLVTPEIRGGEPLPFGPLVEVPEEATAYERLAGFLGRRPAGPLQVAAGLQPVPGERADLLAELRQARHFLRFTVRELAEEQVRERTTVSQLTLGGLVKHVSGVEDAWARFAVVGKSALLPADESGLEAHADGFRLGPEESLAGALAAYERVARRTDQLLASLPDLDLAHRLPEAPWFEPGASWTARRAFLHIIAETTQHAGHADILRESLDGARTMG